MLLKIIIKKENGKRIYYCDYLSYDFYGDKKKITGVLNSIGPVKSRSIFIQIVAELVPENKKHLTEALVTGVLDKRLNGTDLKIVYLDLEKEEEVDQKTIIDSQAMRVIILGCKDEIWNIDRGELLGQNKEEAVINGQTYKSMSLYNFGPIGIYSEQEEQHILGAVDEEAIYDKIIFASMNEEQETLYNTLTMEVSSHEIPEGSIGELGGKIGIVSSFRYVTLWGRDLVVLKPFSYPVFRELEPEKVEEIGNTYLSTVIHEEVSTEFKSSTKAIRKLAKAKYGPNIHGMIAVEIGQEPWVFHMVSNDQKEMRVVPNLLRAPRTNDFMKINKDESYFVVEDSREALIKILEITEEK